MNLECLESFRVFAQTLNFTKAAKLRHLSQPALHKQIQSLSHELGVTLYEKQGRVLSLTETGLFVARFSREIRDRIQVLQERIHQGPEERPSVTLAAGRGSFLYLLGPAIQAYCTNHPESLTLLTTNQEETLAALRSGQAHLGVTVMDEVPPDLQGKLLFELAPHLIVPSDHPLTSRTFLRVRSLDGLPFICPPAPSPMRAMLHQQFLHHGIHFHPVLEASGWDLMMHFADLGLGVAIVNGCCHPPANTKAIPIRDLPKTRYYLLSHRQSYDFPAFLSLRNEILQSTMARKNTLLPPDL
ncbi:MAG: LysR family transcriptional regulator [Verrucomicrobiota bacterium]